MAETYTAEQVRELLKSSFARPIAFQRAFVDVAGTITGALFLSQALYWSDKSTDDPQGWFHKTREQWTAETGLSRAEQEAARKKLRSLKVLEEHLHGNPARLHFRLNQEELIARLAGHGHPLSPQAIIEIYKADLTKMSDAGYRRAGALDRKAERVEYADVVVRDAAICYLCKKQITKGPGQRGDELQIDHVIALEDGGEHTAENLRASHAVCNRQKKSVGDGVANKSADEPVGHGAANKSATVQPTIELATLQPAKTTESTETPSEITFPRESECSVEIGPPLALTSPEPENLPKTVKPDDPDIENLYAIKKAVEFCVCDFDPAPFEWDEADTKAAKAIVAELPNWNADQFAFAVVCRFRSFHINSAEAPRHWLKKLQKYGRGPLDEYGHDKLKSPQERQKYREKVLAELAGRKPAGEQILLIEDEPQEVFSGKPQNSAWEKLPTWLSQKIQTELRYMAEASVGARVDRADPDTLRRSVLIAAERASVWPHVAEQLADESYAAAIAKKKAGERDSELKLKKFGATMPQDASVGGG